MPTTVISTIRASGGDYSLLSTWEAAKQGDLVAADQIQVAECYNDWPSGLSGIVTIVGSTTNASHYMEVTVADGHRHDGTPQSGFYTKASSGIYAFRVDDSYTRLSYLDVWNADTNGRTGFRLYGTGLLVENCLATTTEGTFGSDIAFSAQSSSEITFIQCATFGSPLIGFNCSGTSASIINCSVVCGTRTLYIGSEVGIQGNSGVTVKNSVVYNFATNYSGTFNAASTNNSSSGTDAPGSNPVNSITSAAFVNAAGNDFHLASGSVLIGAGVNLYSTFTTDIDGDTWPSSGAWDIGFDYRVASGGADLAGSATSQSTATGTLTHSVPIAGAGLSIATATGAMSLSIPLASAAQSQSAASATLTTSGSAALSGNATAQANASGGLSLSIPLSAAAVAQALASAGITHGVPLAGAAAGQAASGGALTLNISLSGIAIAQAAASAGLTVTSASSMAAAATAQASASGTLTHGVPLTGAALTVSSAGGALTQIVPLAGSAASASMATGGLDVAVRLQADALAQALAAAGLDVQGGLSGAAAAQAGADATLSLHVKLAGDAVASAIAAGALSTAGLILAGTPGYTVTRNRRDYSVSRTPRTWRISA